MNTLNGKACEYNISREEHMGGGGAFGIFLHPPSNLAYTSRELPTLLAKDRLTRRDFGSSYI